jgi:hypothetical protein
MLYPKNQNWRTSRQGWNLALTNSVNTGVSYSTSSGTVPNQQRWASAGFRGFGPTMTFPGGSGLDGMHGCGCGGGGNGNMLLYIAVGAGLYYLITEMTQRRAFYGD